MADRGGLPHFIVIGAAKAATTWIQAQLQANPRVFMPDPEPHFFSREYERGEDYYRSWFEAAPATSPCVGEKSADYLSDPKVPERIAAMIPDVKLVVQLRDPVERAYSDYKMYYRRGLVSKSVEDYLSTPYNKYPRFLMDGLYGRHLSRWLEHFASTQILAFPFEDVLDDPQAVVEKVSRHIGVEPVFDAGLASKTANDSKADILPLHLRNLLAPLKQTVQPLRGTPLFEGARSLLAREVTYPDLSPDLRSRMEDFYRDDLALLEQVTGLSFAGWKRKRGRAAA